MAHIIATRPFTSSAPKTRKPISVFAFLALARQRRQLAKLDDRLLSDIGVNKNTAMAEATRPIWDVPNNWTH